MKIKEITVGLSGTVPVASYENLKPAYSMTIELQEGDNEKKVMTEAQNYLRQVFDLEANRAKTDLIEKQYANIRFYEKDGKKYPSVTSILGWAIDWKITDDELIQYGARGTVVHKLVELYFKDGKWANPLDLPELSEEIAILMGGSLGLSWKDCSHEKFFEKFKDDIKLDKLEQEVFNAENLYAGRYDMLGTYKGKKTIFDIKTGTTSDFRQLSAYAVCEKDVESLVICSVGKTENKSGYINPKVCDTVQAEFKAFLKARAKFRTRFGI